MKRALVPKPLAVFVALAFSPWTMAEEAAQTQAVTAYPTELYYSPQLNQIGVPAAWAAGATGLNVTVSVIDTGVNSRHTDLKANLLRGYNTVSARTTTDTTDYVGHGTHVTGIIVSNDNNYATVGVAPDAKVLPIRVADSFGNITYSAVDRAVRLAADYTPIANLSLGGSPGAQAGIQYAVNKGLLIVAAAGNEGGSDPIWPARYAKESWAMGRIIAVGAVDANNVMPYWSNRAGDTRNFYLVAPGVDIISTYGSGYAYMSGTSMASPHVAGVAALVKSYWPSLKAEQIASILFQSATDLGDPGVDAVYGWGLVNAERAMQPLGNLTLTSSGGTTYTTQSVGLKLPKGAATASSLAPIRTISTDSFGRGFAIDLAQGLRSDPAPSLESAINDFGRRHALVDKVLPDGSRYTVSLAQTVIAPLTPLAQFENRARKESLGGFSYVARAGEGKEWAVGGNGYAHHFFSAASELTEARDAASANPVFGLVPGHNHAGFGLALDGGWKLKAGLLTTAAASAFAEQESPGAAPLKSALALASLTRVRKDSALSISVGQLAEDEALLGSRSGAGLHIDGAPRTRFASLEGAWKLGQGWAAHASYTAAFTPAHDNGSESLIAGSTGLRSDAFGVGLTRAGIWSRGDRLGLTLSQPLRLRDGGLQFNLPQAQDENGALVFGRQTVSLAPRGHERRAEINYSTPLSSLASLSGFFMLRSQPGHDANAPDDVALGLRWSKRF